MELGKIESESFMKQLCLKDSGGLCHTHERAWVQTQVCGPL